MSSLGLFSQAEEKKTDFTLKEAQDFAVLNSYFTRGAIMDVTMAEQKVKEITGLGLPQIMGNASYNYFIDIPTQLIPANAFDSNAPADEFAELQFGTKHNMKTGIQVNQMIFDGAYVIGLKVSKTYRELAYAKKAKSVVEIKRDVVKAYGLAIVSKMNLDYVKENEAKLKSLVKENQAIYVAGFLEEKDLDQVKLLLLNTQSVLIETINGYKVSQDMLKFTMGMPIGETIVLTQDIEAIKKPFIAKNENLNAKLSLSTHVDYRRASANLESQSLSLSNEKMTYYPKLYGFLNLEGNNFGNKFNAFSNSGKWFPTTIVGLQLNVPIFTGGQRHMKVQQAKVGLEQAELQLEQMEQGLQLDLANKRNTYEAAMNKLDINQKNLDLSSRIKDQTRIKYKEGMSSSVELTQTENQFLQSQINFVLSMYDVITSKADLDYALGKL
jgi:outer membrane protein TolC|tara:strand:+ start:126 stop:1445 length:1320 start_codon:yes stop_codon:yes gene_type:complete